MSELREISSGEPEIPYHPEWTAHQARAEAAKAIMDDPDIAKHLADADRTKLEQIKSVWQTEQESSDVLIEVQQLVLPAIEKIINEKSRKYGFDMFDNEETAPEPLRRLYFALPAQILAGSKKIEDIDKDLEAVVEQITKQNKLVH